LAKVIHKTEKTVYKEMKALIFVAPPNLSKGEAYEE